MACTVVGLLANGQRSGKGQMSTPASTEIRYRFWWNLTNRAILRRCWPWSNRRPGWSGQFTTVRFLSLSFFLFWSL